MKANKIIYLIIAGVIISWLSTPFVVGWFVNMCHLQERGQFGDQFGAASSLFSALGFAVVIYSLIKQKSDLKDQQEDINRNLKILEAQAGALKRSADNQERDARLSILKLKFESETATLAYLNQHKGLPGNSEKIRRTEDELNRLEGVIEEMFRAEFKQEKM